MFFRESDKQLCAIWCLMIMKKALLIVSTALALLLSLMVTSHCFMTKADSPEFIRFPDFIRFTDSGITVFSPLNETYSECPVLNVCLYSAGVLSGVDPGISMNYSIDGVYGGVVPLKGDGEMHVMTRANGFVVLPELGEGSHCLTLYLYGLNQRSHEPKYLSSINIVYFTIGGASSVADSTSTHATLTLPPAPTSTPMSPSLSTDSSSTSSPLCSGSPTQQSSSTPTLSPNSTTEVQDSSTPDSSLLASSSPASSGAFVDSSVVSLLNGAIVLGIVIICVILLVYFWKFRETEIGKVILQVT